MALRHRSLFVIVGDKGRDQARRHTTPTPEARMHACRHSTCGGVGTSYSRLRMLHECYRHDSSVSARAEHMHADAGAHLVVLPPAPACLTSEGLTLHTAGGEPALHAEQDGRQSEAQRPVVLQKGAVHEQVRGQPCTWTSIWLAFFCERRS